MAEAPPLVVRRALLQDLPGIRVVYEASLDTDDLPGITRSDIDRSLSRIEPDPAGTAVAIVDTVVVGAITPRHDDLTVHPAWRRRGIGRALVAEGIAIAGERGLPWLQLYVPSHLPASQSFAAAVGLTYHSSLWLFRLPEGTDAPSPVFPDGFVTRSYGGDGDLVSYVELGNAAFADHPTPLSWPVEVVRHVHALPDFDPDDICLVAPADEPGRLVAFARVEVAPGDDGVAEGWISLIGVLPPWRGLGLGRELLRWSVARCRARGAVRVELSVEALNDRALELYRRHGFEPTVEWPHWIRRV